MQQPIIDVCDLVKRFGAVEAVRGVTFSVAAGEIFGFLGPNGAGKTTTIKMLATLLRPTSGRAALAGYDVVAHPGDVRRSMGIVFQDPSLDNRLTAEQNLRFHAMLYGVPSAEVEPRLAAVLEMVDLGERRRAAVATYSGGM
ncbi:MAG: ATP-binding cassette domain-containing protein [bacterium]